MKVKNAVRVAVQRAVTTDSHFVVPSECLESDFRSMQVLMAD